MKKIFLFVLLGVIVFGYSAYAEETEAPSHRIDIEIDGTRQINTTSVLAEEDGENYQPNMMPAPSQPTRVAPGRMGVGVGASASSRVNLTQISSLAPVGARIFGDLNGDGHVDFSDLKILVENFGPCPTLSSTTCSADLNNDRTVNTIDALLLLNNFTRYGQDLAKISSVLDRCQSLRTDELQRRCLSVSMQEEEVKLRVKNISPVLVERVGQRTGPEIVDLEEVERNVEVRIRNYLKYMSNMLIRMTAAIERLDNLADRIESRIEKFETDGQDLTRAKELLIQARRQIEIARAQQASVSQNHEEILTGENLNEEFARVRELVQNLRINIQVAHQSLVEVISNIRIGLN